MRIEDYPPQEPVSGIARPYREECERRSHGLPFEEFAYGADPYQSVAFHPAPEPNGIVLIFAHGGGWTSGYKEWMGFMAPPLNQAGISLASVGYRLAPGHLFPTGLDDVAAAIAAVASNCGRWGGDADALFVGGHSAGGHYAALLAVRRDWQAALGLAPDVIKGCLPISGVYRLGAGDGLSARPRFLGAPDPAVDAAASPMLNVAPDPPPFLIAHGERDFPHLIVQADDMAARLEAAGGAVTKIALPGCDHFGASLAAGDQGGPWSSAATAWLLARFERP